MEWRPVEGFPQYSVSDQGDIRNDRFDSPRLPSRTQQGSAKVTLYRDGRPHTKSLGLVVARAWVWNDWDPEIFNTPIHLNNDLMDNRACNLAWRPRWFAKKYQIQYYDRNYRFATTTVIDRDTGIFYPSLMAACQEFGLLYVQLLNGCSRGGTVFPTRKEFIFGPV